MAFIVFFYRKRLILVSLVRCSLFLHTKPSFCTRVKYANCYRVCVCEFVSITAPNRCIILMVEMWLCLSCTEHTFTRQDRASGVFCRYDLTFVVSTSNNKPTSTGWISSLPASLTPLAHRSSWIQFVCVFGWMWVYSFCWAKSRRAIYLIAYIANDCDCCCRFVLLLFCCCFFFFFLGLTLQTKAQ